MSSWLRYGVATLVITTAAFIVYRGVIFQSDPALRYPWSSDAWGHLIKADYLSEQIGEGVLYPDVFPQWYSGQQMLRYYAPLPYYGLVGLFPMTDDTFVAGNWFLFLAALVGGLSMLLYARRFGLVFATIGGIWALFDRAEKVVHPKIRERLSDWLTSKTPIQIADWPGMFASVFDRVFGEKHLSWKCFRRSAIVSLLSTGIMCLVLFSVLGAEIPDAMRQELARA